MKYMSVKDMSVGEKYYFVDTDFKWGNIKTPSISHETIYRIVGGDFSTKEPGDRYEQIRGMAYRNFDDATQRALEELERYRQYVNEEIDRVAGELAAASTSQVTNLESPKSKERKI